MNVCTCKLCSDRVETRSETTSQLNRGGSPFHVHGHRIAQHLLAGTPIPIRSQLTEDCSLWAMEWWMHCSTVCLPFGLSPPSFPYHTKHHPSQRDQLFASLGNVLGLSLSLCNYGMRGYKINPTIVLLSPLFFPLSPWDALYEAHPPSSFLHTTFSGLFGLFLDQSSSSLLFLLHGHGWGRAIILLFFVYIVREGVWQLCCKSC